MSSSASNRLPLNGIIRHGQKVVGGICLPNEEPDFIQQFNECYGPLRMKVVEQPQSIEPPVQSSVPINRRYQFSTWYSTWRDENTAS